MNKLGRLVLGMLLVLAASINALLGFALYQSSEIAVNGLIVSRVGVSMFVFSALSVIASAIFITDSQT